MPCVYVYCIYTVLCTCCTAHASNAGTGVHGLMESPLSLSWTRHTVGCIFSNCMPWAHDVHCSYTPIFIKILYPKTIRFYSSVLRSKQTRELMWFSDRNDGHEPMAGICRGLQSDDGAVRSWRQRSTSAAGSLPCAPCDSPSSTSCAGSGTRSWSVARWGWADAPPRCVVGGWGTGWSGTPSPVRASDDACTTCAFAFRRRRPLHRRLRNTSINRL